MNNPYISLQKQIEATLQLQKDYQELEKKWQNLKTRW